MTNADINLQTPYSTYANAYDGLPARVTPSCTSYQPYDAAHSQLLTSPAVTEHGGVQSYAFPSSTLSPTTTTTGLGISDSTDLLSTIASYPAISYSTGFSNKYTTSNPPVVSRARSASQSVLPTLPPTPQTSRLPNVPFFDTDTASVDTPQPTEPEGYGSTKRSRPSSLIDEGHRPAAKRRRSTNTTQRSVTAGSVSTPPRSRADLPDEDQFLIKLKEQNLPWKDIAKRVETEFGKAHNVAALQMRYKRLKDSLRTWTDNDVGGLPTSS